MTVDALAMTGSCQSSAAAGPSPAWRRWPVRLPPFVVLSVLVGGLVATAASDTFNPDDPAYMRRQYVWFQSQDPGRQQQLRKLHVEFLDLAPEDQARLSRVMQTYNAWLARLPESDRRRVQDAPAGAARLETVRDLREREWVESLPRPYREEYAKLDGDARRQRVAEWRAEEVDRREEWALAQKHWLDNPGGRVPTMFQQGGEPRALFEAFVNHLYENLWPAERKELDEARSAADDFGNYFWYGREVVRLADLHPPLPGRVGAKDFASLPPDVKDYLVKSGRFRKKGAMLAGEDMKELRRAVGRWPDFAVELARYCQKNNLKLPVPLGDCRKEELPADVREYLEKVLEPQLKKTPAGQADLEALNRAQGNWPEYPRMILDLAKKHKLPVPGWTLPGPSPAWDKLRTGKARLK